VTEEKAPTVVRPEDLPGLAPDLEAVEAHDLRDGDLDILASFPDLRRLDLSRSPAVTDAGLETLRACPSLARLNLDGLPEITDRGIEAACAIPTLEALLPSGCRQLGDAALAALPGAARLREVFISGDGFTDAGMEGVARCAALETLGMDGPIGDAGYARLRDHPRLRALHLPACHAITPASIDTFAAMPALEELHLYAAPHVDDAWIPALTRLGNLRALGLLGCGLSDDGRERLRAALGAGGPTIGPPD
jgi:hypothetical protein